MPIDDDSAVEGSVLAKDCLADLAGERACDLPLLEQLAHQLLRIDDLYLALRLQLQDFLPVSIDIGPVDLLHSLQLFPFQWRLYVGGALAERKGVKRVQIAFRRITQADLNQPLFFRVLIDVKTAKCQLSKHS